MSSQHQAGKIGVPSPTQDGTVQVVGGHSSRPIQAQRRDEKTHCDKCGINLGARRSKIRVTPEGLPPIQASFCGTCREAWEGHAQEALAKAVISFLA